MAAKTLGELLSQAKALLAGISDQPTLEAELLLAKLLERPRTFLLAHPEFQLTVREEQHFGEWLNRRMTGCPLAYITGQREFWSLTLKVNEHTLIPRPETELLVEHALTVIPKQARARVLDLGTGSGAIALALKSERPIAEVSAADNNAAALAVARANGERLNLTVSWQRSDWFSAFPGCRFDVVVANPPYVAESDPHLSSGEVRFEPSTALSAGTDGLRSIMQILSAVAQYLVPDGYLLLEHGYDQRQAVTGLMADWGFRDVRSYQDLAGLDRVVRGQYSPKD